MELDALCHARPMYRHLPRNEADASAGNAANAYAVAALLVAYNTVSTIVPEPNHRYVIRNVAAGLALVAWARRQGFMWDELGLSRTHLRSASRWGAAAATMTAGVAAGAVALERRMSLARRLLSDRRADIADRELAVQTLVRIPIGTAAFEELAFRSVLFAVLERTGGPAAAVRGSSMAFGLWHVGPTLAALRLNDVDQGRTGAVVAAVVATTAAGLGFGMLRTASGHVLPCWMVHWASNAVGLLLANWWHRSGRATVD